MVAPLRPPGEHVPRAIRAAQSNAFSELLTHASARQAVGFSRDEDRQQFFYRLQQRAHIKADRLQAFFLMPFPRHRAQILAKALKLRSRSSLLVTYRLMRLTVQPLLKHGNRGYTAYRILQQSFFSRIYLINLRTRPHRHGNIAVKPLGSFHIRPNTKESTIHFWMSRAPVILRALAVAGHETKRDTPPSWSAALTARAACTLQPHRSCLAHPNEVRRSR